MTPQAAPEPLSPARLAHLREWLAINTPEDPIPAGDAQALLAAHDAVTHERDLVRQVVRGWVQVVRETRARAEAAEALAETRGRAATALLREKETLAARVAALEGAIARAHDHSHAPGPLDACPVRVCRALGGGKATT